MTDLFLSDLHIGNPLIKHVDFLKRLLRIDYNKIYFIGDVFEAWYGNMHEIVMSNLGLVNVIKSLENAVIIKGNHDPSIDTLKLIFPNIEVVQSKEITLNNENTILIHGDEFDLLLQHFSKVAKALFLLQRLFEKYFKINIKAYVRKKVGTIGSKQKESYYDNLLLNAELEAVKKYSSYENIVMGHRHAPIIKSIDNKVYVDCGDWVTNCSFVEYSKNEKFKLHYAN